MSLWMLDASRASSIWPLHSANASCWSSASQSNLCGWNMSWPPAIVLEIRLRSRVLKWSKFAFCLHLTAEMSMLVTNEGLERKFVCVFSLSWHTTYTYDPIFSTVWWSWKEIEQGSWNESKMTTFDNNFWTAWGRELKFWHIVCIYAGHFVCQFQVTATVNFWDSIVFVFLKTAIKFAHTQSQWVQ